MNTNIQIILFFYNRHKNLKSSKKQFVAILAPLPDLDPSSINHIAKANGVKYISKLLGIISFFFVINIKHCM